MSDIQVEQGKPIQNKALDYCPRGHAYTEENSYVPKDGRRRCRTCRNTRALDRYRRTFISRKVTGSLHHAYTHGHARSGHESPEYEAYRDAKKRCNNPRNRGFSNYGGRGIEFRFTSYEQFLRVIGRRPSAGYSLDRIDVNGHYEPGNVRWATKEEQMNNKRDNRPVIVAGAKRTIRQCSEATGLTIGTITSRLNRGWCGDCIVSLAPDRSKHCSHKAVKETS